MKCEKCGFETESDPMKSCPGCGTPFPGTESAAGVQLEGMSPATPGRRWSARIFDLWLGSFMAGFLQGLFLAHFRIDPVVDFIVASVGYLLFALCLEALEYRVFGGTFGKWCFAVKVLDAKGAKLGAGEYAHRLLRVYATGLWFGLPFVMLVPQIIQWSRVRKGKAASYDEKAGRIVVQCKQGFVRGLVVVLFVLIFFGLMALGNSAPVE